MSSNFRRILLILATGAMIVLPGAVLAQQGQGQDSGQGTNDAQSGDQGRGGPWAQRRGARKAGPRQRMEMLARKLNLTDEQRQQFQKIGQHMWQQSRSIHNDSSLTDEQKRGKLQALRKQSHIEMFSVLTPEQKEQLKQLREQQRKDLENKAPGDQASAKPKPASSGEDDDPFAGMTSDDDDGPPVK